MRPFISLRLTAFVMLLACQPSPAEETDLTPTVSSDEAQLLAALNDCELEALTDFANTASADTLRSHGLTDYYVEHLLLGRTISGGFEDAQDVADVHQIGPRTLQRLISAIEPACVDAGRIDWTPLDFTIEQARASAPGTILIQTHDQFQKLLGVPPPAEVDFDREDVLFVSAGTQSASAAALEIDALYRASNEVLALEARLSVPGETCNVLRSRAPVYALLRVPTQAGEVRPLTVTPHIEKETFDCGTSPLDTEAMCRAGRLCPSHMICSGITLFEEGFCRELQLQSASTYGLFEDVLPGPVVIPTETAGAPLVRILRVEGLTTVPEDAIVRVEIENIPGRALNAQDLYVVARLVSSSQEYEVLIWDPIQNADDISFGNRLIIDRPAPFEGDNVINGEWAFEILDRTADEPRAQLVGLYLEATSRFD